MIEEKARTLNLIGLCAFVEQIKTPKYSLSKEQWSRFRPIILMARALTFGRLRKADRHLLFGEQLL